jgi:hypothetical protein
LSAAQAGEVALGLIGAGAIVQEREADQERQRPALTLAHDHHDAALAVLVLS